MPGTKQSIAGRTYKQAAVYFAFYFLPRAHVQIHTPYALHKLWMQQASKLRYIVRVRAKSSDSFQEKKSLDWEVTLGRRTRKWNANKLGIVFLSFAPACMGTKEKSG